MDGRVDEIETSDRRRFERVSVKELGLGFAAVAAFSVPPAGAVAVNFVPVGTSYGDGGTRDGNQGARPLFIAEGCGAFEDNLSDISLLYLRLGLKMYMSPLR